MPAVRRSRAREVVLQVLYQDDMNPRTSPSVGEEFLQRRVRTTGLLEFARDLLAGVRRHRPELDQRIESAAEHWTVHRMAVTDRNVLRIGAYELLHADVPAAVAINEAVELAKRYGTAQSAHFVNGILDRLSRERGGEAEKPGD